MKVTFETNEVLPRLIGVASVINAKNAIPILSDVCVSVKNDSIILTASDGENWVTERADILSSDSETVFCTNAKDLISCLSTLSDENVTITLDEDRKQMTIDYVSGKMSLPYESSDDFPYPNINVDGASSVIVDSNIVKNSIKLAKSSTENSTIRPIMGGVHFKFREGKMTINGACHKRVVKIVEDAVLDNESEYTGFTLPQKASSVILSVLESVDGDVKLRFTDKVVSVSNKNFKITARLLEGAYPDCDMVIPKKSTVIVEVDNECMVQALRRVLSIDNANRLVVLSISSDDIKVSAEDVNYGRTSEESVGCDNKTNNELEICFNGDVLSETLKSIKNETVLFEMSEPERPALICSKDEKEREKYISVMMPMVIRNNLSQQQSQ